MFSDLSKKVKALFDDTVAQLSNDDVLFVMPAFYPQRGGILEEVVAKESDIHSEFIVVEQVSRRKKVADTDGGKILKEKINDLELLLEAYRDGTIRER